MPNDYLYTQFEDTHCLLCIIIATLQSRSVRILIDFDKNWRYIWFQPNEDFRFTTNHEMIKIPDDDGLIINMLQIVSV
jgi:hypothetical protein